MVRLRYRHLLAVLAGKLPSEVSSLPEFSLEGLDLPADIPVSLPSSRVRLRPDILVSESILHTASAVIGERTHVDLRSNDPHQSRRVRHPEHCT